MPPLTVATRDLASDMPVWGRGKTRHGERRRAPKVRVDFGGGSPSEIEGRWVRCPVN